MAADAELLIDRHGPLLTLTINRPAQRNALSLGLLDRLAGCLADHRDDPALRVVVLTGAGDRCFAAGGDLKELDAVRSEAEAAAMSRRGRAALDGVRRFPLPVVAALNGLALGGGAELAMACDLRIAAASAEIGFLQGQLNVTTAWGGGIDLAAAVGPARALELLASARRVPATEARDLGLVQHVAGAEADLAECTADWLRPWLARSRSVLAGFKTLAAGTRMALHAALADAEQSDFVATWTHADHWDAVAEAARRRAEARR